MKLLKILPLIGIALFLYIIIYRVGIGNLIEDLTSINPLYLLLAVSVIIPRTFIVGKKWDYILKKQNIKLPFFTVLKTYFIGTFYGALTPGWLGTYVRIPYVMKKAKIPLGKSTSNVVIDTIVDLVSVLFLIIAGTILIYPYFPNFLPIVITLLFVILSLCIYLRDKKRSEKYFRLLVKLLIPSKYKEKISKQFESFYSDIPKVRQMIVPIMLAMIAWILSYTQIYLIAEGLFANQPIHIPYVYFILVYPLVFLVELIPISISGLGIREGALIALLSVLVVGITEGQVATLSILGYFATTLTPAVIGSIFALREIKG